MKLDDGFYKLVDKLERLVRVPPSLRACRSLTVKGPVRFGEGVVIRWGLRRAGWRWADGQGARPGSE